ncbi:MAG: GNAT family N-acetyltransferase [Hoeflea sp.]|uniref:GNAT family N-acetyltransferase n=1 Tax=Hoeflea sp. TaxID=1940281 RepID=UPI0032EEE783
MPSGMISLDTQRLALRPQSPDDFEAYAAFLASDRSAGMGGPFDRRAAWGMFCHDHACWSFFGHGALMIELKATKECIGQVGINHGPLFPEKELGWLLYGGHEGKGYASEAAAGMLDWAWRTRKLKTVVSYVDPDNLQSHAVAKRIGGRVDPAAPRMDPEDIVYRHFPPGS